MSEDEDEMNRKKRYRSWGKRKDWRAGEKKNGGLSRVRILLIEESNKGVGEREKFGGRKRRRMRG